MMFSHLLSTFSPTSVVSGTNSSSSVSNEGGLMQQRPDTKSSVESHFRARYSFPLIELAKSFQD